MLEIIGEVGRPWHNRETKIVRPVNFTLLGHGFVPTYKKGERGKYQLCIAGTSWGRLKRKIREITRKTTPKTVRERIGELNQLMRGWVNYFKQATGYQKFKDLDAWIRCRLRYCIWKQWKRPQAAGLPSIGRGSELGQAFCLLPDGRLGNRL